MSVNEKTRAFEEVRGEFGEYARAFHADVRRRRREFERAGDAFAAYAEEFAAVDDAFAEYAEEFAEGVREKGDLTDVRAAFRAKSEEVDAAVAEFAEAVAEFRGDVDPETVRRATAGGTGSAADARDSSTDARDSADASTTDSGATGSTSAPDPDETGNSGGSQPTAASPDSESPGDLEADADDHGGGTERPRDGNGGRTGVASAGVDDDRAELVAELRQVQYAKLKRAANTIGYEGNLNNATKDELVSFIADNADQVEAALVED